MTVYWVHFLLIIVNLEEEIISLVELNLRSKFLLCPHWILQTNECSQCAGGSVSIKNTANQGRLKGQQSKIRGLCMWFHNEKQHWKWKIDQVGRRERLQSKSADYKRIQAAPTINLQSTRGEKSNVLDKWLKVDKGNVTKPGDKNIQK